MTTEEEEGDTNLKDPEKLLSATTVATHNKPQDAEHAKERKKNKRRNVILFLLALLAVIGLIVGLTVGLKRPSSSSSPPASAQSQDTSKWPHEISDIPPDHRVKYGTLPNGVRYMAMSNGELPGRISLRLHVDAGWLNEDDDQKDVAHFLEHLCFEGTKNFPDTFELTYQTERLGAHNNAYTTFDETVYFIDFPSVDNYTLTTAFTMIRDFADGALLEADTVEAERGVVLNEDRERDSVESRIMLEQLKILLPDHRIVSRWPNRENSVVATVPRHRVVDFYTQYYVPERITVVAVGDLDVDDIEEYIRTSFESMPPQEDVRGDPDDMGAIPKDTGFQTAVFSDEELVEDELWMTTIRPWVFEPDTTDYRIQQVPLDIAHHIMDNRFDLLSKKEDSPIRSGFASRENMLHHLDWGDIVLFPVENRWKDAVRVLEQEVRRILDYGVTEAELEYIKDRYIERYESRVQTSATRESSDLSWDLIDTINSRQVFSTPETNLEIIKTALDEATTDKVHQAFKDYWSTEDITLFLATKEAQIEVTAEALEQLYMDSKQVEVAPTEDIEVSGFGYTDFGSPGTVVADTMVDDLQIRQLILSNNVRVNLKQTDFDKSYVEIAARFGTGRLEQPPRPGFDSFCEMVFEHGGLGKHSLDEIDYIFSDNSVWNGFWVNPDDFDFEQEIIADDMEPQLQLMSANIIDPGYREEAVRDYRGEVPSLMRYYRTYEGAFEYVDEWLWGNDPRFSVPRSKDELLAYQAADVKEWIHPQLQGDYLELSIVGDFDVDATIPVILKTFGALPERNGTVREVPDELRAIYFPETPSYRKFTYTSKVDKASAIVAFKIPSIKEDRRLYRRINLLTSIFSGRLFDIIREELGESYSPYADADASTSFDTGYIWAESQGAPEVTTKNSQLILDIAQNMSAGIGEDEFIRAKAPLMADLEESLRSNSYWLYRVMFDSQQKPWKLDWVRERDEDYDYISIDELEALAAQYLVPSNAVRIDVLPVQEGSGDDETDTRALRRMIERIKGNSRRHRGPSFAIRDKKKKHQERRAVLSLQ